MIIGNKLALAIALAAFYSGSALAAGGTDWNGFYTGVSVGYTDGDSNVGLSPAYSGSGYFASSSTPAITTTGAGKISTRGTGAGIDFGYNHQSGSTVVGFEVDWTDPGADGDRTATGTYPCCAPTGYSVYEQTKAGNMFTARGRLGYASNNSLFYVTAGWAQVKIKVDHRFADDFADASESFAGSESKSDWVYGVGYEHAFEDAWTMRLEYLHADFGQVSGTSTNLSAFTPAIAYPSNVFTHTADLKMDMFRIGFNYRF